jgi:hypothetical protein
MLLRIRGEESLALCFSRLIAPDERRELMTEASATPQMANRLMKNSNSVDKGDDSFLFVKKMARGFLSREAPMFPTSASLFI